MNLETVSFLLVQSNWIFLGGLVLLLGGAAFAVSSSDKPRGPNQPSGRGGARPR
jgi:hypothetical protein